MSKPEVNPMRDREIEELYQPARRATARHAERTLTRIVESYFDAITSHDGSVALTHPGCGRVENGTPAPAGRFLPPNVLANAPAGQAPPAGGGNDCVGGLQKFNGQMVVARRVPLIDEMVRFWESDPSCHATFVSDPVMPAKLNELAGGDAGSLKPSPAERA